MDYRDDGKFCRLSGAYCPTRSCDMCNLAQIESRRVRYTFMKVRLENARDISRQIRARYVEDVSKLILDDIAAAKPKSRGKTDATDISAELNKKIDSNIAQLEEISARLDKIGI